MIEFFAYCTFQAKGEVQLPTVISSYYSQVGTSLASLVLSLTA